MSTITDVKSVSGRSGGPFFADLEAKFVVEDAAVPAAVPAGVHA